MFTFKGLCLQKKTFKATLYSTGYTASLQLCICITTVYCNSSKGNTTFTCDLYAIISCSKKLLSSSSRFQMYFGLLQTRIQQINNKKLTAAQFKTTDTENANTTTTL